MTRDELRGASSRVATRPSEAREGREAPQGERGEGGARSAPGGDEASGRAGLVTRLLSSEWATRKPLQVA